MTTVDRPLPAVGLPPSPPTPRRFRHVFLPGLTCALLGWLGATGTLHAQSRKAETAPAAAAAGIRPTVVPVGPVQSIGLGTSALSQYVHPEDIVVFDAGNSGTTPGTITVVNGGYSGTFGATTTVASSSVGSGVAFHPGVNMGCISPSQQLYYWDPTLLAFVSIDLTQSTYPRALTAVSSNTALVPGSPYRTAGSTIIWDYSTSSILYVEDGSSTTQSTIASGIYRYNPVTGANTLYAPFTKGTVQGMAIKQDGSAVYILTENQLETTTVVSQIAQGSGALTVVDGGSSKYGTADTSPRYVEAGNISWDILNQKINVYDEGDDQTTSRILRLDPSTQTRTFISNGSAGPTATYGGSLINSPSSGYTNTAGRLLYAEINLNDTAVFPATIPSGSATSTEVGTIQFSNEAYDFSFVPPTLPIIASPTATAGSNGTTATLGANVTSAGTAVVTPTVQTRGVVYAPTATNSNPTIGGAGVTQVASTAATGTYTVSASGLATATMYSYAGYVSTYYGTVYTSVAAFTTASAPSVTTSAATSITSVSAALNGNVTSNGGATLTVRGFVYSSTNTMPTLTSGTTLTDSGTSTGTYADTASGLTQGTTYYFRAYATNGVGTTYGSILTFTTVAPPTANSQSVNVAFNTATAVTLTGSDPNTPAQTLTYSVTSQPGHGTLSGTAPNLTYTPTTGYHGSDSFQFTTTNTSNLTSNAATVTLTVATGTPTANAQSVNVPFNTATAVTLTATDPDSPALTLTYTVVTNPGHGTLSGTAPNLTYTPTANYQGSDSFAFSVSNGTNTSAAATVTLTVAAGTPTANAQSVSVAHATAKAITLSGTDPNSPALSLTYTVVTAPAHGTLSGTAPNLTYTPTATYQGSDSFTFTVSNGQKTSAAATINLTVAAGTPTATAQSVNVNLNMPKTITLAGTDPDSPALALTYTIVTQPTNGTLSGTAPNLTYTPNTGYTGTDSFTFTVSNGQNTSAAATVSLTVIGQPTISSFTPASGPVGTTVTITGTNLQNAVGVNFLRNVAGTSFTVISSTQVTVKVPAGASSGILTLLSGSGSNSSSTKFIVTQ